MKCAHRRRRRKSPSGRKHAGKRAVQALTAGAVIAAGTQAYAAPIRFNNPMGSGHFNWIPSDPSQQDRWLDVDAPPESQPGVNLASCFQQRQITETKGKVFGGGGESDLQIGGPYGAFLLGVDSGVLIPSGLTWGDKGYVYYPGFGSQLPNGEATYLGVRFKLGASYHYGWIGVIRQNDIELEAFAWGYETEPGVSIPAGAPEPGTLALLAFGALLRRRR